MVMDDFGLLINLPAGAVVVSERLNDVPSISVRDPSEIPVWTMRIQRMTSTLSEPTAQGQIEDHLKTLKETHQQFKNISNKSVDYGSVPGQLCYIEQQSGGEPVVFGWLIVTIGERDFLVFSLNTLPGHFPKLRSLIEASFGTISLRAGGAITAERKGRLESGQELLAGITPQKLREQVGVSQWFRFYKPAANNLPETERGYSCLSVFEAGKDAVELKNAPDVRSGGDTGLLVQIRGRVVFGEDRNIYYYDSEARYWMSWDQSEEIWAIVGTQRQGEAEVSESETGVRSAATPGAAPHISVTKTDHSTRSSQPYEWDVPEVYLSQTLGWLLPRLLPRDITAPREFGYYFYNLTNNRPQISLRSDLWEPTGDAGSFRLTTKLTSDSPAVVSIYGHDGSLIRRVHGDGSITEPTTLDDLRRSWKAKGLSVSKSGP
jgi:hypothetical protein